MHFLDYLKSQHESKSRIYNPQFFGSRLGVYLTLARFLLIPVILKGLENSECRLSSQEILNLNDKG